MNFKNLALGQQKYFCWKATWKSFQIFRPRIQMSLLLSTQAKAFLFVKLKTKGLTNTFLFWFKKMAPSLLKIFFSSTKILEQRKNFSDNLKYFLLKQTRSEKPLCACTSLQLFLLPLRKKTRRHQKTKNFTFLIKNFSLKFLLLSLTLLQEKFLPNFKSPHLLLLTTLSFGKSPKKSFKKALTFLQSPTGTENTLCLNFKKKFKTGSMSLTLSTSGFISFRVQLKSI